jgi:uncharacterized membrane protein SpoIIM required for sporulation
MIGHRTEPGSATVPAAAQCAALFPVAGEQAAPRVAPGVPSLFETVRLASALAIALTLACGLVAVVVDAGFAAQARPWLAFPFTGIPARPGIAAGIFLHNLRALAAVGGLLLIAQSAQWTASADEPTRVSASARRVGEVLLGGAIAANLIIVGASFGAYGTRMLRAALPHGPLELAAYSLTLALYRQGRTRALPARHMLAVVTLSVVTLALAAVLETYVNL